MHELAPPRTGVAVFVFGSIAAQRGGVTRAIIARMRLYAERGLAVRLLLLDHSAREDDEEAAIRQAWSLPDSVEIRYFWREAAPSGGGAPTDERVHADSEPGLTAFTERTDAETLVRFYHEGLLVKTKHFIPGGRLLRTDHHDAARRTLSREYFDPHGLLVRIDDVDPDSGHATLRRWFARSGTCWLTSWLTKSQGPTATVRHTPCPVAYRNFAECAASWIDSVLTEDGPAVVFSDSRAHDRVLLALSDPNARKVAVLHNVHTSKPYRAQDAAKSTWRPLFDNIDNFHAVVVLTARQRDDIERHFAATNLTVINHPAPPRPQAEPPRTPGLLVTVARLETQKRLEHAIRAFALALPEVPQARFDVYGTGSQAAMLKSLVTELGIAERVRFLGFTEHAAQAFASATATVLSSSHEGFPLVLNEAMGVGTPFVSYDLNYGPDEVIRHEVDGLLVPYGDIDALSTAMLSLLGDSDYAAALGERACEVLDRFSTERWQREWTELFERLVAAPPLAREADSATTTARTTVW